MSSENLSIAEKIERVRGELGLSVAAFAQEIGVAATTLKSITQRGSSPSFDVVEKIAGKYPQFAFYLFSISIKERSEKQIAPQESEKTEYKIIQNISMLSCECNKCCVKPEWFSRIMLIEAMDEINTVMCIVVLHQFGESTPENICIKIGKEDFNFYDQSGINKLERLRNWFVNIGREDLIKTAELYFSTTKVLENLHKTKLLLSSDLSKDYEDEMFGSSLLFSNWVNDLPLSGTGESIINRLNG